MFKVKKPGICAWISQNSWNDLSLKEKDFIIFVHSRKYTKEQIMRKLYIEDRTSYWRLQNKVKNKIKDDVAKYNEHLRNRLQKQ